MTFFTLTHRWRIRLQMTARTQPPAAGEAAGFVGGDLRPCQLLPRQHRRGSARTGDGAHEGSEDVSDVRVYVAGSCADGLREGRQEHSSDLLSPSPLVFPTAWRQLCAFSMLRLECKRVWQKTNKPARHCVYRIMFIFLIQWHVTTGDWGQRQGLHSSVFALQRKPNEPQGTRALGQWFSYCAVL